jgi:hypothetical protein
MSLCMQEPLNRLQPSASCLLASKEVSLRDQSGVAALRVSDTDSSVEWLSRSATALSSIVLTLHLPARATFRMVKFF